jgi:hypothetical protein
MWCGFGQFENSGRNAKISKQCLGTFSNVLSYSFFSKGAHMQFRNASEIRAQAEKCFRRSQLTDDDAAKLCWLSLAEGWQVLFETGRAIFKDQFELDSDAALTPPRETRHYPPDLANETVQTVLAQAEILPREVA